MKQIVIATTNQGKKKELLECFEHIQGVEWLSLADFDPIEDVEETGKTFEENALLKAKYYAKYLQKPVLGEDSGFVLEALPDMFGINTKRQLNAKDDNDWLSQFIDILETIDDKRATFYSSIAYYDPANDLQKVFLGSTSGEMEEFPQTPLEPGIPVSSIFVPDGFEDVYSAMTKKQKAKVSHRGKACRDMESFLISL